MQNAFLDAFAGSQDNGCRLALCWTHRLDALQLGCSWKVDPKRPRLARMLPPGSSGGAVSHGVEFGVREADLEAPQDDLRGGLDAQ